VFATYKDGQAHLNAYLDDLCYSPRRAPGAPAGEFDPGTLAIGETSEVLLEQFEDRRTAGSSLQPRSRAADPPPQARLRTTPRRRETAWRVRPAAPALSHRRVALRARAERTLAQFHSAISEQPGGHATLLIALEEHQRPTRTVILAGRRRSWGAGEARSRNAICRTPW